MRLQTAVKPGIRPVYCRTTAGNYLNGLPRVSMLDKKYVKYVNRLHKKEIMKNKYPPLPHPFYDRGEFGTIQVDCYNDEQMRAYADAATNTLRAQLAEAQRDAERYRSLRRGQKWSVIDWKGDALRADDLDAAIDAAKGESNA